MMTLCLSHIENEKCGLKKYVIVIFFKLKKGRHKMNNSIVRCIKIYPIFFFFIFQILTCDFLHFLPLIFHFTLKSLNFSLNFLNNHMFRDIYRVVY
jgi:hypothetical protein